ncbi:MAG: ABC transporter ATP-binding protein, partial [Gemmatimonadota bacterium]|nr:ABC transporter ATP-binding protein [Gemmatimonadota bacterium]
WDQSAAVFQDYTRFAFSLGENIGLGRTEQMGDQAAVERAAHQGGAAPIAEQLPEHYNTLLTKEFAGGTELSGGEWQRVAISRGFMRNAALIVLDEPTASLDPQAEADVFRRFLAMSGERTTIVVSHRLGSARLCDRILVLKEGRLLENGTHGELLSQGGEYARLWALQAQWYGEEQGTY